MNIDERIAKAIAESHPNDLTIIKHYITWVKLRRKVNDAFYRPVHWVKANMTPLAFSIQPVERRRLIRQKFPSVHWVGR